MKNQKKVPSTQNVKIASDLYEKHEGVIERIVKELIQKGWTDGDISRSVSIPHQKKTGRSVIPQWSNNIRKRVAKK